MSDDNKAPLLKLEHYRRLVDNSLNALVLCLLGALVFALYQLYVSVADTAVDTYSLVISFCLGIGLALVMSIVIILIFRKSVIPGAKAEVFNRSDILVSQILADPKCILDPEFLKENLRPAIAAIARLLAIYFLVAGPITLALALTGAVTLNAQLIVKLALHDAQAG